MILTYIGLRNPNLAKSKTPSFSSIFTFITSINLRVHRLTGCIRVKLKPWLQILPGLAKNWKIYSAKAKHQSHQNTISIMYLTRAIISQCVFFTLFLKIISLFLGRFLKHLPLCMVSTQKRVIMACIQYFISKNTKNAKLRILF